MGTDTFFVAELMTLKRVLRKWLFFVASLESYFVDVQASWEPLLVVACDQKFVGLVLGYKVQDIVHCLLAVMKLGKRAICQVLKACEVAPTRPRREENVE